jgi:hypothetical protein
MSTFFCEMRNDYFLGGDEARKMADEMSDDQLIRLSRQYPATGRRYFATDECRHERAIGNSARAELSLRRAQSRNALCYCSWSS